MQMDPLFLYLHTKMVSLWRQNNELFLNVNYSENSVLGFRGSWKFNHDKIWICLLVLRFAIWKEKRSGWLFCFWFTNLVSLTLSQWTFSSSNFSINMDKRPSIFIWKEWDLMKIIYFQRISIQHNLWKCKLIIFKHSNTSNIHMNRCHVQYVEQWLIRPNWTRTCNKSTQLLVKEDISAACVLNPL